MKMDRKMRERDREREREREREKRERNKISANFKCAHLHTYILCLLFGAGKKLDKVLITNALRIAAHYISLPWI